MIEARIKGNEKLMSAALTRAGIGLVSDAEKVTSKYASLALALVKKNASGRPGPRRITGDYLRSWSRPVRTGPGEVSFGTNAPQARRLENGFFGRDSLGRLYRQRAYPHVKPARYAIEPLYRLELMQTARDAVRKAR